MMSVHSIEQIHDRLYNTPLESGLRTVILLVALEPRVCDLQRLIYYDYLLVHSGDVPDGPESVHPATPYRSGEVLVRRKLIEDGIRLMMSRGLIFRQFTSEGITYCTTDITVEFVAYLESFYARELKNRASWVSRRFVETSDEDLRLFMNNHLDKWGAEFVRESMLWQETEESTQWRETEK